LITSKTCVKVKEGNPLKWRCNTQDKNIWPDCTDYHSKHLTKNWRTAEEEGGEEE
jgi:hypothetical protein